MRGKVHNGLDEMPNVVLLGERKAAIQRNPGA